MIQLFVLSIAFLSSCNGVAEFWKSESRKPGFSSVVSTLSHGSCKEYGVTVPFPADKKEGQSMGIRSITDPLTA
jgi:hypothetical protein